MMIAKRGAVRISAIRCCKNQDQIFSTVRGKHSAKPATYFEMVQKLLGSFGPRIDLFARSIHPGWDAWGLEIPGFHYDEDYMYHSLAHIIPKFPKGIRS